jgi:hypothetical protein
LAFWRGRDVSISQIGLRRPWRPVPYRRGRIIIVVEEVDMEGIVEIQAIYKK